MGSSVDPVTLGVLRATALLESRADLYTAYLHRVFEERPQWRSRIERWGREESDHGDALRAWLADADPGFDFGAALATYRRTAPYHGGDGGSVRGSLAGELVSRCVIEALASTYYRALRDTVVDPTLRALLDRLARDEARHFGLFLRMLREERAIAGVHRGQAARVALRRVLELDDDQIMRAHWVARGAAEPYRASTEIERFLPSVYAHYRIRHLEHLAAMLSVLFGIEKMGLRMPLARATWIAIRARGILLRVRGRARLALTGAGPA